MKRWRGPPLTSSSILYSFFFLMLGYSSSSTSNRNRKPLTVEDYIALLQGVKEKYGNLPLKFVPGAGNIEDEDEIYDELEEIAIVGSAYQSLIADNSSENKNNQALIFALY